MRVLLDENLPRRLARLFGPDAEALAVSQRGWAGLENGELPGPARVELDAFVTVDRGIPHQLWTSRSSPSRL